MALIWANWNYANGDFMRSRYALLMLSWKAYRSKTSFAMKFADFSKVVDL